MFHPQGPSLFELARQALSSTEVGYDLLAPKFDYTPFCTPSLVSSVMAEQLGAFDCALDLGCGTGVVTRALQLRGSSRVVGIDFSRGMLAVAQEKQRQQLAAGSDHTDASFVRGDFFNLPFREAFDLAVCAGALGHVRSWEERTFIREIQATLKPGGRFAIVTGRLPALTSAGYWISRLFNATMRVRNALLRPPFIMYYLTFMLPRIEGILAAEGFTVEIRDEVFPKPFSSFCLLIATKANPPPP